MVISAVPKTQLTLSLSSSNLLISGHSAKAYSHSALDRLSRYRVRNKLTSKLTFTTSYTWIWGWDGGRFKFYLFPTIPSCSSRSQASAVTHKELALLIRLMSQTLILIPGTSTLLSPLSPLFGVRGPLRAENVLGTSWQWWFQPCLRPNLEFLLFLRAVLIY